MKTKNEIPENELWLHQGDNIERIEKSLEWTKNNPRNTDNDNFEEIIEKIYDLQCQMIQIAKEWVKEYELSRDC